MRSGNFIKLSLLVLLIAFTVGAFGGCELLFDIGQINPPLTDESNGDYGDEGGGNGDAAPPNNNEDSESGTDSDVEVTPELYTVVFYDFDGSVITRLENVEKGSSVTPPKDPIRDGYIFVGWDKEFLDIADDLNIFAQYEEIVISNNNPTFIGVDVCAEIGGIVTVKINIENNPGILGMILSINVDDSVFSYVDASKGAAMPGLTLTTPGKQSIVSPYTFVFDGITLSEEDKVDGEMLILTFRVSENAVPGVYEVSLSYSAGDIFDDDFNELEIDVINAKVTVS